MDNIDFPFFGILSLILCSGFFSATETSFLSLSKIQLREIEEKNPSRYKHIRFLLDRPTGLIVTTLIGNECANVLISNLLAAFYNRHFDSWLTISMINLFTAVPMIVLFGEITPRVFAAKSNTTVATAISPIIFFTYNLIFPLRFVIEQSINLLSKVLGIRAKQVRPNINEEDFMHLLEEGKNKGVIKETEKDLIENIFELDDEPATEIATPINSILTVQAEDKIDTIIQKIKQNFIPRIPVLSDDNKEIIGVLYSKDLLNQIARASDNSNKVKHLMKEPVFFEPQTRVETLFKRMRQLKIHIAFLAPEGSSASSSLITMDAIMNYIFEEQWEEN